MHILITGATGFIGKSLTQRLLGLGHTITIVSRNSNKAQQLFNQEVDCIQREDIHPISLSGIHCIIHLAGASITSFPWNPKNKQKIHDSRIETTKLLVHNLPSSCHTFICGSAIGYYPSSFTKQYDTSYINTTPASFMEQLCVDWEKEATKAQGDTTRVITLRTGLVMGPEKLGNMLRLSTKYLGGIILGSGNQWMPLITLDEWVDTCIRCIEKSSFSGPINMVTRNIKHKDYIQKLAHELHRPVRLRIPQKVVKLILGEVSQLILGSWYVTPTKI